MTEKERKNETFKKIYELTKNGGMEWNFAYKEKEWARDQFLTSKIDDYKVDVTFSYVKEKSDLDYIWISIRDETSDAETFVLKCDEIGGFNFEINDMSDIIFDELQIPAYTAESVLDRFLGGSKSERRERSINDLLTKVYQKTPFTSDPIIEEEKVDDIDIIEEKNFFTKVIDRLKNN